MIREARTGDFEAMAEIYSHYVLTTATSFEIEPVSGASLAERRELRPDLPWLVYEQDDRVIGYAFATTWKSRAAYYLSCESSIYLHPDFCGQGIGKLLYAALLEKLRYQGMHSILAGIALPNPGSIRLHESLGFEKVAQLKEVGHKFGEFIDVGYWQILIKD